MQRYQHGTETLYFEDGVTPQEMEAAAMRVDQQRAAIGRAHQTRATIEQIKQYLANAEVQAAHDAALIQQAREDAVAGHQRFTELRHEEQRLAEEEARQRAEEAAAQERPERLKAMFAGRDVNEPPDFLELVNDRNMRKMPR